MSSKVERIVIQSFGLRMGTVAKGNVFDENHLRKSEEEVSQRWRGGRRPLEFREALLARRFCRIMIHRLFEVVIQFGGNVIEEIT